MHWLTEHLVQTQQEKRIEVNGKDLKSTKEQRGKGQGRHYNAMRKKENSHPVHLRRTELQPTQVCENEHRLGSHPGKNFRTAKSV